MSELRYPSKTFRIGNDRGWLHFRSCFYPHDYAMSHFLVVRAIVLDVQQAHYCRT